MGQASSEHSAAERAHSLLYFFAIAYAISWPFFILAGLVNVAWITLPGLFGPALAGLIMANVSHGQEGLRRLLGRFRIWRISPIWLLFALFFPATTMTVSVFLSPATSGSATYSSATQWYFIPAVFIGLFLVVVGEELGWRGYALPLLQKRWNALVSSLVLAVPWTIWHFAILTNPVAPNIGSIAGLAFVPFVFAISVIFTAVFNNTKGSLLAVLAYHASGDTAGFFLNESAIAYDINVLITVIIAIIIVAALGQKHLSRSDPNHK